MDWLWSSPLGPIAVLLAGGALLLLFRRHLRPRWARGMSAGFVLVGMALWLMLRWQVPGQGAWWLWQAPLGLETAIGLQWYAWTWLAGWLMGLVAGVALMLPGWPHRRGVTPMALWTPWLLAAGLAVITAGTWATLLMAWSFLLWVVGVMAGTPPQHAARVWSFLLLAGLWLLVAPLFNGPDAWRLALTGVSLNLQGQLWLALAAAFLAGMYPFHGWLIVPQPRGRGLQLVLHGVPALAALAVLERFSMPLLSSLSWIALGIVGLLGSALAAWAAEDEATAWRFVVVNRVVWAFLGLSLGRELGDARGILPLTALGLGMMLWGLGSRSPRGWARWLALAFVWGMPLTPGFPLHALSGPLAASLLGLPGWLLLVLAQGVLLAVLLRAALKPAPEPGDTPSETWLMGDLAPLLLVGMFGLGWGIFPSMLARTGGMAPVGVLHSVWAQGAFLNRQGGWLPLVGALILGMLLWYGDVRLLAPVPTWRERLMAVARLDWLYRFLEKALHTLALGLGFAADILDGAGQFGWVLVVLLILWLFFR